VRFIYGFVFAIALLAGACIAAVYSGAVPGNADSKPSGIERWLARTSLHATINRDVAGLTNPLQATDDNLTAGAKLYGENCAVCHGASDGNPSKLAQGFNIAAPQLAKDGVTDDPVTVSYWKIKHGIRFSAMPAFTKTLTDEQIWQVSMFVAKMDQLPPGAQAAWKALPSQSTDAAPGGGAAPAPKDSPAAEASPESSPEAVSTP
jgi:mono/diheme cytochrome c family protein